MNKAKHIIIRDKNGHYSEKIDVLIKLTPNLPYTADTISGYIRYLIDLAYDKQVK